MIIVYDIDEVLNNHISCFIDFHNNNYKTNLKVKDFFSYSYWKVLGETQEEMTIKYFEFQNSTYFDMIKPFPGAQEVVKYFHNKGFDQKILTSRNRELKNKTTDFLNIHYKDMFSEVYFANNKGKKEFNDNKNLKAKILKNMNPKPRFFIEDNLEYASEAAVENPEINIIIFSPENYFWNKTTKNLPDNTIYKQNWKQIKEFIKNN